MLRSQLLLAMAFAMTACQSVHRPGETVTLSTGETCQVLDQGPDGTRLTCPGSGEIILAHREPILRVTDIPGVPHIPPVPQSGAEAACRAGQYAQGRVQGAAEAAALDAVGLPGNLLGIWRRSQDIARRVEGRPAPATPDPCRTN
ncbi:hypothetical protein V8J82_18715 [Gymnodinialimonas sp. 2305UL16-5]|uniref:hypothetical protein n=1 Tax=Gymnodinialimonas mytili TaxID=3126503 RepID=UPI0030B57BBF